MAAQFLGTKSLQDTVERAADELLQRLHQVEGCTAALLAAENHRRSSRCPHIASTKIIPMIAASVAGDRGHLRLGS
jgi:hypothetical protein